MKIQPQPRTGTSIINLSSAYTPASYAEDVTRAGWVKFGEDNTFPDYLIDLYYSSSTHGALCNSIAQMIYGEGVTSDVAWDINDLMQRSCLDFKIHGGFAWELLFNMKNELSEAVYLPFERIRSGDLDMGRVREYYYAENWSANTSKRDITVIPAFDPNLINDHKRQVLYVRPFSPGSDYYPKPDYIGSIDFIELDKRVGRFHLNNIKNGLAPSFIIKFKSGEMQPEERDELMGYIETKLQGEENSGKWLATFSNPDDAPDFETFPVTDLDKQYEFISRLVTDKVMIGHRVTSPALFGVKTPGELGGTNEVTNVDEVFDKNVVQPARQMILKGVDPLFSWLGKSIGFTSTMDESPEVAESYTGIQISSAIDIITKVNTGELNEEQGKVLIQQMLGFSPESAAQIFAQSNTPPPVIAPTLSSAELDALIGSGEIIDAEDWEVIDEIEVTDTNVLSDFDLNLTLLARVPSSNPNGSSEQDNELFKVRYEYAGGGGSSSRQFCTKMIGAGKVYRIEDIEAASERPVNPGFGPNGSDTYDLLLFKGGPRCRHWWRRRIYLRRNNKSISVNEARKIINAIPPKKRDKFRLPENDPKVAQQPNDMPNHAYLNPPA